MTAQIPEFEAFIRSHGFQPPASIHPGRFHRFPTSEKRGDLAGYAKLFADCEGGIVGDFRSGEQWIWQAKRDKGVSETDRRAWRERLELEQHEAEAERERAYQAAAQNAARIWAAAAAAPAAHEYLTRKGVQPYGLKLAKDGALIVPFCDSRGELLTLQFIFADGEKRYLPGGRRNGTFHTIGTPCGVICICEGYATGASIHAATGFQVRVAGDAGNLARVACVTRDSASDAHIVICADNDVDVDGEKPNVGLIKASEAAKAADALLAVPDLNGRKCDFNDLHRHGGDAAIRQALAAARKPETAKGHSSPQTAAVADTGASLPIDAAKLLDDVHHFLGRFVAYPSEHAQVAHALWIAHAHLMTAWENTPRIAFLSPEPGSGKTRALEITETLVPRPVQSVNASSAYLFRKISDPEGAPTILYDEIDTVFGQKAKDNEELRGLFNAGHRRGATAGRCVKHGNVISTEEFPAYCALAMAGLGALPDTILTAAS
jgi:phage/plasmid primase-like uncharacterized protein